MLLSIHGLGKRLKALASFTLITRNRKQKNMSHHCLKSGHLFMRESLKLYLTRNKLNGQLQSSHLQEVVPYEKGSLGES